MTYRKIVQNMKRTGILGWLDGKQNERNRFLAQITTHVIMARIISR